MVLCMPRPRIFAFLLNFESVGVYILGGKQKDSKQNKFERSKVFGMQRQHRPSQLLLFFVGLIYSSAP